MNVRRAILMMQLSKKQGNVCNTYKAFLSRLYLRQIAKLFPRCITQHPPLLFIPHSRNGQILLTLFINKVTKSQSDFFKDIIFKGNFVVFLSLIPVTVYVLNTSKLVCYSKGLQNGGARIWCLFFNKMSEVGTAV